MTLANYGVLKGRPVEYRLAIPENPHFQIHLNNAGVDYRVSVNVKSEGYPSELEYVADDNFQHPITATLSELPLGFTALPREENGLALDYIRGNLFNQKQLRRLPFSRPGPDNDLNDLLESYLKRAIDYPGAMIYAYGEPWGPERNTPDKIFGFLPGNGVHDVHMNQGNSSQFRGQNGVWQDGGLLIQFPAEEERWIAVFLKFQSQTWHTTETNGQAIPTDRIQATVPAHIVGAPDQLVRIIAAMINPFGPDSGHESVTLINTSPHPINLTGWSLLDKQKNKQKLSGAINPGSTLKIHLENYMRLDNSGGIITLLNKDGFKVDGVSYTATQARLEGWTVVF